MHAWLVAKLHDKSTEGSKVVQGKKDTGHYRIQACPNEGEGRACGDKHQFLLVDTDT